MTTTTRLRSATAAVPLVLLVVALLLSVLLIAEYVSAGADYYALLGVKRNASVAMIKKAYRKLAARMHPDVNKEADAEQRWMEITRAYEVLTDARQKEIYDQHGEEGVKQSGSQQQQQGATINFGGPGGFTINFGQPQEQEDHEPPKGPDMHMDVWVTLRDLYLGKELQLVRATNDKQEGRGSRKCNCRQQMVTKQQGYFIQQVLETKCDTCPSIDFVPMTREIDVEIERGTRDGFELTFSDLSDPVMDGSTGTLVLRVKTVTDKFFRRDGDDLYIKQEITLLQSLVGFDYTIKHLDGHDVRLQRDAPTKPGFELIVPNEGMPKTDDPYFFGDLHVEFSIKYPESLTPEQVDGVKALFA